MRLPSVISTGRAGAPPLFLNYQSGRRVSVALRKFAPGNRGGSDRTGGKLGRGFFPRVLAWTVRLSPKEAVLHDRKKTAPLGAVKSREETPKEGITAASDCKMTLILHRTNVNGFGTGFKQNFSVLKFYPLLMEVAANVKRRSFLRREIPV